MEQKLDLRITKTYRALENAFTELLDEKRFEEITVGELCERAMIRRTTFYKHFADKYEYFSFYVKELRDRFASELPPDMKKNSPTTYIKLMSRNLYRFMRTHDKLVTNITTSNMVSVLFGLLNDMVMRDIMSAINSSAYTPEERGMIASFYAGGLLCTLKWWTANHTKVTEDQFIDAVGKLTDTKFSELRFS